jgi:hypothetical protein
MTAILVLFCGCRRKNQHPVNFYYWKTSVLINNTERDYFNRLECRRLYLRLFDIDVQDDKAVPLGKIKPFQKNLLFGGERQIEYVPVVFMTNRTFEKYADKNKIQKLALQVSSQIKETTKYNQINEYREIQIDCDWATMTKNAYFEFLHALHDISKLDITCTLRLHQVKDKENTGIPPVKRGYLMCYATSDPTEEMERNSILDIGLLKSYTKNIKEYPINLDIALPLYSWGIIKNHLGKTKLMNGLTASDLQSPAFRQTGENSFEVIQDCFLQGTYLNSGFTIKIEEITPELLKEAKTYLDEKVNHHYNIVYFHLSKGFLERFTINDLR